MENNFPFFEISLNTNPVGANNQNEKLKLIKEDKKKYHESVRLAVEAWDKRNEKNKDES